jgi:hypothetical protein
MADYLEVARRALAAIAGQAEPDARSEEPTGTPMACAGSPDIGVPPITKWPRSLRELAEGRQGSE